MFVKLRLPHREIAGVLKLQFVGELISRCRIFALAFHSDSP
jgi:hypothetical protein